MVTAADLEDIRNEVADLREQLSELRANSDHKMRVLDMKFADFVRVKTAAYTTTIAAAKTVCEGLEGERRELEKRAAATLDTLLQAHRSEMQRRELLYQDKMMDEVERYQALERDVELLRMLWENKRIASVAEHEMRVAEVTAEVSRRLELAREKRQDLETQLAGIHSDWEEARGQMEDELDKEAAALKRSNDEKLEDQRDARLKYKGENGIMVKKYDAMSKEKDEISEEIKRRLEAQKGLYQTIANLEKEIGILKITIDEKGNAIEDKEKRIAELKRKNQELEKYKYVLDHKIRELKQQIEPRANELAKMKKQIKSIDGELGAYHSSNLELDEFIGQLRIQMDQVQARNGSTRSLTVKKASQVKAFTARLMTLVLDFKDPATLIEGMQVLEREASSAASTFAEGGRGSGGRGEGGGGSSVASLGDQAAIEESGRQRAYLEKRLVAYRKAAEDAATRRRHFSAQLIEENMDLIEQAKAMRKSSAALKAAIASWDLDRAHATGILKKAGLQDLLPELNAGSSLISTHGEGRTLSSSSLSTAPRRTAAGTPSSPSSPQAPSSSSSSFVRGADGREPASRVDIVVGLSRSRGGGVGAPSSSASLLDAAGSFSAFAASASALLSASDMGSISDSLKYPSQRQAQPHYAFPGGGAGKVSALPHSSRRSTHTASSFGPAATPGIGSLGVGGGTTTPTVSGFSTPGGFVSGSSSAPLAAAKASPDNHVAYPGGEGSFDFASGGDSAVSAEEIAGLS